MMGITLINVIAMRDSSNVILVFSLFYLPRERVKVPWKMVSTGLVDKSWGWSSSFEP
jgi:hypothetical protein